MIYGIVLLGLLLIISIFYLVKFSLVIIRVQEDIENSLEQLDDSYNKISEILTIPIFHDSLEVRNCLFQINRARNIVLSIANSFSNSIEQEEVNEETKKEK